MASYARNGPTSRALALDLMLRTFMNSADFNLSNSKVWDNISRLVPGTTPQQCAQRWEELLISTNSAVAGDLSGLAATGRPISSYRQRRRQGNKLDQPTSTMSSSNIRPSSGIRRGISSSQQEVKRPLSVMSGRVESSRGRAKEEGVTRSLSNEDQVWGRGKQEDQVWRRGKQEEGDHRGGFGYWRDQTRTLNKQDSQEHTTRGTFTTTFYKNLLNKPADHKEQQEVSQESKATEEKQQGTSSSSSGITREVSTLTSSDSAATTNSSAPNMIIHVCDDAKKLKNDFICPRDILVQEMRYFADYLSSEAQLWDEVDISVHCDIPVFEWLMRYTKQGLLSGPSGEQLTQPLPAPKLEVGNAVSILISSEFLKMDRLVEECLVYCHDHMSAVIASPCNMACINDKLVTRLAAKFTPLEAEEVVDKKDKLKSKLFMYQLEQLFKPTHSSRQCPANAATLYMCKHCKQLLTSAQEKFLPCTTQRLSIDASGQVVYSHERNTSWNINMYIQCLQQHDSLSPQEIYWRVWSLVNTLKCSRCQAMFQCRQMLGCPYHPQPVVSSPQKGPLYPCCSQSATQFSMLPSIQRGCCFKEHTIAEVYSEQCKEVYSILQQLSTSILTPPPPPQQQQQQQKTDSHTVQGHKEATTLLCLLQSEHTRPHYTSPSAPASNQSEVTGSSEATPNPTPASSSSTSCTRHQSRDPIQGRGSVVTVGGTGSEMEEDEEEEGSHRRGVVTHHHVPGNSRAKRKVNPKQRHLKHDTKGPNPVGDWIWNTKKSKRWNQDMQRENDERRQQQLMTRLAKMNTTTSKSKEVVYAGGIFSKLDAQFRAQQTAKAMAIQPPQSRSHGSVRKKITN